MNINSVSGYNFLTLGAFNINLNERGLLLIQGQNDDDPSADSNGAGKSSLPDAISWALYGTTARGITGDAVINRKTGKLCGVTVAVGDGDTTYTITRTRAPNALTVKTSTKGMITPGGGLIDLTKGTQAETQEVINKIMGCSLEVFNAAVYAGQEAMPDLPGMTDKQLKLLIEEAAGVEVLADAYRLASVKALAAEKEVNACNSRLALLESKESSLTTSIVTYAAEHTKFGHDNAEKVAEFYSSAKVRANQAKALDKEIAAMDGPGLTASVETFEKTVKVKRTAARDKLKDSAVTLARLVKLVEKVDRNEKMLGQAVSAAEHELGHYGDQVGEPCPSCGKPVLEKDVAGLKVALEAKLAAACADRDGFDVTARTKAKAEMIAVQAVIDATEAELDDTASNLEAFSKLTKDLTDYKNAVIYKDRLIAEVKAMMKSADETGKEVNPFNKLLDVANAELVVVQSKLVAGRADMTLAQARSELLVEATKIFGQSGVRAHILDTVTPFLNARTSEYLGAMTDGNIHAVWNTLQKTAKGELRERFNIEVTNDTGAESFAGMSGGEKRKVRLAAMMALQDMVASRAEKPLNILVCDEIDNALDESGLERLMTVLEQKARERGTVLIISHNSLSDYVSEVITVTKKAGISTISES